MKRVHHELVAWQQAMLLVRQVYELTAEFPADERFGLVAQMRRAAVSIPSNIAEGAARQPKRQFAQFLIVARGSLSELDTQFRIAQDLVFCPPQSELEMQIDRLFSLLGGLLKSQRESEKT
ncbi:MAG: four helix bundle protein [Thiobacillus sp.]